MDSRKIVDDLLILDLALYKLTANLFPLSLDEKGLG